MAIPIPRKTYDECEKPRTLIPEGVHLVEILEVEGNDASEFLTLKYRTQMPVAGMEGEERFYLVSKTAGKDPLRRLAILAKRAGLQDRGTQNEEAAVIDPLDLVGMQFVVRIENEQKENRKGEAYFVSKWTYADFWPPEHPDAQPLLAALRPRQTPSAPSNGRQPAIAAAADPEV